MAKRQKKVFDGYKNAFTIEKVSVGYDKLFKTFDKLAKDEVSLIWYPPYNIRKTTASEYVIDVELTGYDKGDISAKIEGDALVITAPGKDLFVDPEGDDVYYHQGIWPGGELYAKFWIAEGLELAEATYSGGIVSFKFQDSTVLKPAYVVPIGPFDTPAESKPFEPVFNSEGEPVGRKDIDTGEVSAYEPEARIDVAVVVNEENKKAPTVEVVALDPMPQIVELEVEALVDEVDKKSAEPQATLILNDATYEVVPDNVVTEVIKTEEGKSDIVVAVTVEDHAELTEAGIDINKVLTDAIAKSEVAAPELPAPVDEPSSTVIEVPATGTGDIVEVVIPEVLPSVVEATVEDGQVVLTDTSASIPEDATVIPVVSAPGQPDIAVAVTPETQVALDELGIDVVKDVSAAVIESKVEVAPAEVIPPPVFPDIAELPVIVNGENTEVPTVEVVLPDPLPQIVEVSLDKVAETVDPASEAPQATITVEEAVHEVSDNVITEVIKTEEGKSDIVVAIPEEVHAELTDKGIDVIQAVTEAIAQSELPAPEAPVVEVTAPVETPITTSTGEEVTVVAPEIIPQVMEATVEVVPTGFNSVGQPTGGETTVVLTDVSTNVPADAELIPVVTAKGEHDVMIAVTPETQAALDTAGVDVAVDVGAALVEAKTEVVVADVVPTEVAPAPEAAVTETVLNADNPEVPTVSVTMPDPMPQIVEATIEPLPVTVDPTSTEPQVQVTLSDATFEVSDAVATEVIKTPEGQSDVVVAVTEETKAALEAVGVDVMETVKAAVEEAAPAAPELPAPAPLVEAETITVSVTDPSTDVSKLEVTTPDVIPQVVEAVIVEPVTEGVPAIELVNVSENVPADATLIPVVTQEGQPDVMVAVSPEVQATLEAANVDIATDVSKALVEGEVEVAKTEEVVTQ
jgi:HSP20 family molecular chaperone IbpA